MSHTHPRRRLKDPDGRFVMIDRGVADIIAECWRLGIETISCCQDAGESLAHLPDSHPHMTAYVNANRGRAYVDFDSADDAAFFLTLLGNHGPRDAFYRRMSSWFELDAWKKTIHISDLSEYDRLDGEPVDFQPWLVQVSFPATDIPEIVRRLRSVAYP